MLKQGDKAPDFALPDKDGETHRLSDHKGEWVVLYFYPKDDTPGCTKEACAFRDRHKDFKKKNAVVFGVSKDTEKSHAKFVEKYGLPFAVLSDPETKTIREYGAWQKKRFMGREFMGVVRMSYLIDPKGKVAKVYSKVRPNEHADEVLADLKA